MRWYKNENSDFFYCDELLDLVGEFLREFSEIYQREFQRKPNIHELESILSLAFRTGTDDHLSKNSDGKFIDNVRFKISKRNKKQTCAVGDVFSIPLPSGGYGFGRIIYLDNVKWNVSAVFSYYSNNKIYSPGIIHSKELMPPVLMMPSVFFYNWRYTIIHHDHNFIYPQLDDLCYVSGSPGHYWVNKVGEFGKGPTISDEDAIKIPKYSLSHPDDFEILVENELRKKGLLR
ncbi:hypothetical protein IIL26_004298 [Salmonella enterica subsp. enterica serovar Kingston]|nr:hypothetical protein [Salmonella enterica subsp. enterica serovar Isangi]EHK0686832.1 hypothetical protein [Salmonella enterica subsp. enterica serovar Kingston]